MNWCIEVGDCQDVLRTMPARSVHTVVTSPPYYSLRDYGVEGQIGLEPTVEQYVTDLCDVFDEVRRVMRDDATLWINLGDTYGTDKQLLGVPWRVAFALQARGWTLRAEIILAKRNPMPESVRDRPTRAHEQFFLLSKRPTYFYDSDAIREDSVKVANGDPMLTWDERKAHGEGPRRGESHNAPAAARGTFVPDPAGRNKRSVWWVASEPFSGAHFAVFGTKWIEPCILAGAPEWACRVCGAPWTRIARTEIDDSRPPARQNIIEPKVTQNGDGTNARGSSTWGHWTRRVTEGFEPSCSHGADTVPGRVLDPFAGAGTAGLVALQHGRDFIGIELNESYARMARERIETAVRLGFRPPSNGLSVPDDQEALF